MKLVIEQSAASDMNFRSSLYKMQTDQLSFEKFEELFEREMENENEDEDEMPEEPLFDSEWRASEKQFLHAEQPAVFVVVADMTEFVKSSSQPKLMLDAGEIDVDFQTICGNESEMLRNITEVYRDLLAITSTSTMVQITVKLKKLPMIKFQDFLKSKLKFCQLSSNVPENENSIDTTMDIYAGKMDVDDDEGERRLTKDSHFFYCDENYFKGMLIRLRVKDQLKIELKVYLRSNHQIVTFTKAIYGEYSERCFVEVKNGMKNNQDCNPKCNLITKTINSDVR